jgi:hypothetical protein
MQLGFYEFQLLILVSVCTVSIGVERHLNKKTKHQLTVKSSPDERLEDGVAASAAGSSGLPSLMRKYLVVYAIVMGALSGPCWFPS